MKKLIFIYITLLLTLVACNYAMPKFSDDDPTDSIHILRYDRVESRYLTTGDFSALQEMNISYPTETRALIEDMLKLGTVSDANINKKLLDYFQDPTLQEVVYDAESEYADISDVENDLRDAFERLQKEIPEMKIPTFYAQIGAFTQSIVVDDSAIGISLDKYLGSDYKSYGRFYDADARQTMNRKDIVPDCVIFYLLSQYNLDNFDSRPQSDHDLHMATILWVTNNVIGWKFMWTPDVQKVEKYMKAHPDTTYDNLLKIRNYSVFG